MIKTSKEIKTTAQANLKSIHKTSGKSKYNDTLEDAVRIIKVKNSADTTTTGVHILGVRNKNSGTFRTRFFEGGTNERFTKKSKKIKPHYTGRIPTKWFFKDAIADAEARLIKNLQNEIDKITQ